MTDPDVPLLADLDAGLLDPDHARDVRRAAQADPRSAAVLDALAATRADLAALPAPVAPPELVTGWLAALDQAAPDHAAPGPATSTPGADDDGPDELRTDDRSTHDSSTDDSSTDDPVTGGRPAGDPARSRASGPPAGPERTPPGTGPGRRRRRGRPAGRGTAPTSHGPRRLRWMLAAAGAALVVAALVLRPTGPPDLTRVELAAVARSTVGTTDLGELADPARRESCLAVAGYPAAELFGVRQVRWEGVPGVLLVLSTGELGVFRALVVTPGCVVLADEVVGR